MPGLSIHVVDVSRGVVATGMFVELFEAPENQPLRKWADGLVSANGLVETPAFNVTFAPGYYLAVFHVGSFYARRNDALPDIPFLDVIHYRFGISDPAQHYHLPMKCTPWGYSCFRGGA